MKNALLLIVLVFGFSAPSFGGELLEDSVIRLEQKVESLELIVKTLVDNLGPSTTLYRCYSDGSSKLNAGAKYEAISHSRNDAIGEIMRECAHDRLSMDNVEPICYSQEPAMGGGVAPDYAHLSLHYVILKYGISCNFISLSDYLKEKL